jgi:hypothetical protein
MAVKLARESRLERTLCRKGNGFHWWMWRFVDEPRLEIFFVPSVFLGENPVREMSQCSYQILPGFRFCAQVQMIVADAPVKSPSGRTLQNTKDGLVQRLQDPSLNRFGTCCRSPLEMLPPLREAISYLLLTFISVTSFNWFLLSFNQWDWGRYISPFLFVDLRSVIYPWSIYSIVLTGATEVGRPSRGEITHSKS